MAHFLVSDGREQERVVFTSALALRHHTFDVAEDGEAAERMALAGDYDGIFTNLFTKRIDGMTFLRRVATRLNGRTPRALYSRHMPELANEGRHVGALWFLHTPVTAEQLQDVIAEMLKLRGAYVAPERLVLEDIRTERNAEVRRILRECYGEERYLADTGARLLDMDTVPTERATPASGSITRALLADQEGRHFLVASDGSTKRVYYMEVPDTVRTCQEAYEALSGRSGVRTIVEA